MNAWVVTCNVHVTAIVINDQYLVAALITGFDKPACRVQVLIRRKYSNLHAFTSELTPLSGNTGHISRIRVVNRRELFDDSFCLGDTLERSNIKQRIALVGQRQIVPSDDDSGER